MIIKAVKKNIIIKNLHPRNTSDQKTELRTLLALGNQISETSKTEDEPISSNKEITKFKKDKPVHT